MLVGLMVLALPAVAAAEPKPIAKPANIAPIKPTQSSTPPASPPSPPSQPSSPPAQTNTPPPSPPPSPPSPPVGTKRPSVSQTPVTPTVIVVTAAGGRDQSGSAVPAPPPPDPTPLGLVGAADRVTAAGKSTPAWKIALLALLAASEAFLVVRLVRNRPGGEVSPEPDLPGASDLSPSSDLSPVS
jgi:hypothetical protein